MKIWHVLIGAIVLSATSAMAGKLVRSPLTAIICPEGAHLVTKTSADEYSESCKVLDKKEKTVLNHGPSNFYAKDATWPNTMGYFKNGAKMGDWVFFYPNSTQVWVKGKFEDGKGVDIWYMWNRAGKMIFKGTWQQFITVRKREQPNNGKWFLPMGRK